MSDRPYQHESPEILDGILRDVRIGEPAKNRVREELAFRRAERLAGEPRSTEAVGGGERKVHDSGWEADYHAHLEALKASGAIRDFRWKDFRLRLVKQDGERDRYYSPEALVWKRDGTVEVHEIKGHKREAAMLRFDLARAQWPMFRFRMLDKHNGDWRQIRGEPPGINTGRSVEPLEGEDGELPDNPCA